MRGIRGSCLKPCSQRKAACREIQTRACSCIHIIIHSVKRVRSPYLPARVERRGERARAVRGGPVVAGGGVVQEEGAVVLERALVVEVPEPHEAGGVERVVAELAGGV